MPGGGRGTHAPPGDSMRQALVPLVDAARVNQPLRLELREAFERVLQTPDMHDGGEVAQLETLLAREAGTPQAVGVSAAGTAVEIVLEAAGIGAGDEVLVPANAATTVALAIADTGATPVVVDVDPDTALLDPDAADAAVTPRTAAVVAVDAYGQPFDAERVVDFAARRRLFVLEDATHALHGAWDGMATGSLGDAAVFGFEPGDSLGSLVTAGAVTTNDPALATRVRHIRARSAHGECRPDRRMGELDAALVTVKLRHAIELVAQRREVAAWYADRLTGAGDIIPLRTLERAGHAHDAFVVRVPDRDRLLADLDDSGIDAAVAFPRPLSQRAGLRTTVPLPGAEALATTGLALPLFPGMVEWQVELTVAIVSRLVRLDIAP